jgi:hypothetical protein
MKTTHRIPRAWKVLLLLALPLAACEATVGAKNLSIPKNSGQLCADHCQSIGMRLSAVAIMAENVGCVCQPPSEPSPTPPAAGAMSTPIAGMATIAMQQAAAAAQRSQQQARK